MGDPDNRWLLTDKVYHVQVIASDYIEASSMVFLFKMSFFHGLHYSCF